jgi:Tfp pilus assembly protein PilN
MTAIRRSFFATLVFGLFVAIAHAGEPAPAKVADALKQLAPANVTVERVEFVNGSDTRFLIAGRADRNATVSNYLRALDTSESFHKTELLQIMLDANGRPSFEIMVERRAEPIAKTPAAAKS